MTKEKKWGGEMEQNRLQEEFKDALRGTKGRIGVLCEDLASF